MANDEERIEIWNKGYVQAMKDVLDWVADDLKDIPSYSHVVANITKRAETAIEEIEGSKE